MDIANYIVAPLPVREEKIMNAQFYKVIEIYEKNISFCDFSRFDHELCGNILVH